MALTSTLFRFCTALVSFFGVDTAETLKQSLFPLLAVCTSDAGLKLQTELLTTQTVINSLHKLQKIQVNIS